MRRSAYARVNSDLTQFWNCRIAYSSGISTPRVRQGAQSALIEFADFGILTHDDVCGTQPRSEVALRIGQRFGPGRETRCSSPFAPVRAGRRRTTRT